MRKFVAFAFVAACLLGYALVGPGMSSLVGVIAALLFLAGVFWASARRSETAWGAATLAAMALVWCIR